MVGRYDLTRTNGPAPCARLHGGRPFRSLCEANKLPTHCARGFRGYGLFGGRLLSTLAMHSLAAVCVWLSRRVGCDPNANASPPALPNVSPTFIRGAPREVQVTGPAPLHRDLGLSWAWLGTLSPDHQGVD